MATTLLDVMAADLRLARAPREGDGDFACRLAYSALRFWMQAHCIDDGYGGALGITQEAVERKALQWVRSVGMAYPEVATRLVPRLVHDYCNALVAVGDLVVTDDGLLRCTAPHEVTIVPGVTTTLGLVDPSQADGVLRGAMVVRGEAGNLNRLGGAWRMLCGWDAVSHC